MNPPKSFIHQENAPQNAHRPAWWRQSLSWGSLSPGDSSLWQTDSWVWQTTLKPSLSVLRARLHSSNVFHACAMAGLIKSPSQSCLWILRYILCSPWPLDIWPSRMYTLKTSTIFFKKGSHFLVFFFSSSPYPPIWGTWYMWREEHNSTQFNYSSVDRAQYSVQVALWAKLSRLCVVGAGSIPVMGSPHSYLAGGSTPWELWEPRAGWLSEFGADVCYTLQDVIWNLQIL